MKLKDGFYLESKDGQNIVKSLDSLSRMENFITLNRSAAFLFKCLEDGCKTKEELFNSLINEMQISTVLALNDIDIFVRTMKENGIIEE